MYMAEKGQMVMELKAIAMPTATTSSPSAHSIEVLACRALGLV